MGKLNKVAAAAALTLLASCSRTTTRTDPVTATETESKAEAKLCQKMSDRGKAINEYPSVSQETALDDLKKANNKVEQAIREVQQSAQGVNNPQLLQVTNVLEVDAAYQKLQDNVNSVPGGRSTVGDASDSIRASADQLRSAWGRLYQGMQCGA
jgi:hypothetical protein